MRKLLFVAIVFVVVFFGKVGLDYLEINSSMLSKGNDLVTLDFDNVGDPEFIRVDFDNVGDPEFIRVDFDNVGDPEFIRV